MVYYKYSVHNKLMGIDSFPLIEDDEEILMEIIFCPTSTKREKAWRIWSKQG